MTTFRVGDRVEWNWLPAKSAAAWSHGLVTEVRPRPVPDRETYSDWIVVREDGDTLGRLVEAELVRPERTASRPR